MRTAAERQCARVILRQRQHTATIAQNASDGNIAGAIDGYSFGAGLGGGHAACENQALAGRCAAVGENERAWAVGGAQGKKRVEGFSVRDGGGYVEHA